VEVLALDLLDPCEQSVEVLAGAEVTAGQTVATAGGEAPISRAPSSESAPWPLARRG
jgi:hypothetical protein